MAEMETQSEVTALAVELLSAYLANNTVASEDLAGLIRSTRAALLEDAAPVVAEDAPEVHVPAVSVRKSLASPDHIISLIDGKPYKVLKRHLATHGLTPETYRERYNLAATYPMVAPTFAAHRRAIAEKIGLGSRKAAARAAAPAAAGNGAVQAEKPAGRRAAKPAANAGTASVTEKTPASATTAHKARGARQSETGDAPAPAQKAAPRRGARAAKSDDAPAAPKPARQKRMAHAPKSSRNEATADAAGKSE